MQRFTTDYMDHIQQMILSCYIPLHTVSLSTFRFPISLDNNTRKVIRVRVEFNMGFQNILS